MTLYSVLIHCVSVKVKTKRLDWLQGPNNGGRGGMRSLGLKKLEYSNHKKQREEFYVYRNLYKI